MDRCERWFPFGTPHTVFGRREKNHLHLMFRIVLPTIPRLPQEAGHTEALARSPSIRGVSVERLDESYRRDWGVDMSLFGGEEAWHHFIRIAVRAGVA